MLALGRSALQKMIRPSSRPVVRTMAGHDTAEAAAEMVRWEKYSYGALLFSAVFGGYIAYIEYQHSKHPEHHEKNEFSHLKVRNKPYPWSCPDCNLFDLKCWRECKEARKA